MMQPIGTRKISFWALAVFLLLCLGINQVRAEDCNVTKYGQMVVSPEGLQFYVTQEQLSNPIPITVNVKGYTVPESDGCATTTTWQENIHFCWTATKSAQWITLNSSNSTIITDNDGSGSFTVGIDVSQLKINSNIYGANVTVYDGNVTVTGNISTDPAAVPVTSVKIPVRVYVNALRYAVEKYYTTTDWLDLTMNVPVTSDLSGALYVLAEHPSLAPGQVFAYRWDSVNGTRFDLFSQWGHPVAGAENLYYAVDIQNTPIAIPFTGDGGAGSPVIPYDLTDVANTGYANGSGNTTDVKALVPINFGGGLRLIGMEGDWIIRAVVGDPGDITNYQAWRELLYYVLHIRPITGTWVVTEEFNGQTYTYIDEDTGAVYPLLLNEERGVLSGEWQSPNGQSTPLTVSYANNSDQICDSLAVQGSRLVVNSCVQPGGYEVYFNEPSLWGVVEYLYKIDTLDAVGGGKIEGSWQWRFLGETEWSTPQNFSAVRQEVVVPLDPSCNCYLVSGAVNGYAQEFIVDTGAAMVLLNSATAPYLGVDLTDINQCVTGSITGVGGTTPATFCYVTIEIEGRLSRSNVLVAFSDTWTGPGLLGMTFLDNFHISTSADDGTMIIAP